MFITPQIVDNQYTQAQIDAIVNQFLIDVDDFELIACLGGSAHGVKTLCRTCDDELNACMRKELVRQLFEKNEYVTRKLKYSPIAHYASKEFSFKSWMDGIVRFQIGEPGIEAVNVQQEIEVVLEDVDVIYNFTAIVQAESYILVPFEQLSNPENATFRSGTALVNIDETKVISRSSGSWKIYLEAMAEDSVVTIYPCDYVYADIETPENGSLTPVYPESNQFIHQAKPSKVVNTDYTRYYFRISTMIDPNFVESGANLEGIKDYYKMIPQINFVSITETEKLPVIVYKECDCGSTARTEEESEDVIVEIIDAERGIVEIDLSGLPCRCKNLFTITVWYKTDPYLFSNQDLNVKEALAYFIASDLPLSSCNCTNISGFIATAQKAYTKITVNPITGNEVENFTHGNLYGQLKFSERLRQLKKFDGVSKI